MRRVSPRRELVEQARISTALEIRLERRLTRTFNAIARDVGNALLAFQPPEPVLDSIAGRINTDLSAHYRSVIQTFGLYEQRLLAGEKQVWDFEAVWREFMSAVGALEVQYITRTTREKIVEAIQEAFDDNLDLRQTAKLIRQRVGGVIGAQRARVIARTETHNAASYANHSVAESIGEPRMTKRWVSADDDRTRPHHRELNGTTIPIDEDFEVPYLGDIFRMKYPGDPAGGPGNVINCRCVLAYVLPEDAIFDDD